MNPIKYMVVFLCGCALIVCGCGYNSTLRNADKLAESRNYRAAIENYKNIIDNSKDDYTVCSAELGLINAYIQSGDYKSAYRQLTEFEKNNNIEEPFAEWLLYNKILVQYNLNLYVETFNDAAGFLRTYKNSKMTDKIKEYAELSMNSLGKTADLTAIINSDSAAKAAETEIKPIRLEITDFYKDDFGYAVVTGITESGALVYLNREKADVDATGKFSGKINYRFGRVITVRAEKSKTEFSTRELLDTEEPAKPYGLELAGKSSGTITVRWNANTEKDLLGYNIYMKLNNGKFEKINTMDTVIKNTNYTINGRFNSGDKVQIQITALDKMRNESEHSDILELDF